MWRKPQCVVYHSAQDKTTRSRRRFWSVARSENRLYRYRSSHIRSLCRWSVNSSRDTLRGRLRDDVKQNFTHLARASPDRVALLILYCIDLSVCVQRKNHWLSIHSKKGLPYRALRPNPPLSIKTGTLRHMGARFRSLIT